MVSDTRCKVVVRRLPPSLQVGGAASMLSYALECLGRPGTPPGRGPPLRPSHLPTTAAALQEEAFRGAVREWIERADWFSYVQGKARWGAPPVRPSPAAAPVPSGLPTAEREQLLSFHCAPLQLQGPVALARLPAVQGRRRRSPLPAGLGWPRLCQRARHAVQVHACVHGVGCERAC